MCKNASFLFQQNPWTTFRVGLFSGCFLVLTVCIIITGKYMYVIILVSLYCNNWKVSTVVLSIDKS